MDNKTYTAAEIAQNLYSIDEGFVRSFLIAGEGANLLVDCGMGGGGLVPFIKNISDKPVTVALTHGDGDHTGALPEFGSCYAHPSEFAFIQKPGIKLYALWENEILSYGGYEFSVIHTPGHTPGSIMLFDHISGTLIAGDSLQEGPIFMFGQTRSLSAYVCSLKKLVGLGIGTKAKQVLSMHYKAVYEPSIIPRCLEAAEELLGGNLEGTQPEGNRFGNGCLLYEHNGIKFLY
ncbi:MAG: MBL fold metallo-hydrolase [Eubacteriaceae bacterium]|nr:MBL fold metallo-hydrolase [Eubacteriaceae bacterium]